MSFRALLVTKDSQAVETIAPVLSYFGLMVQCCGYSDAVCLVTEQKFEAVLVDFDDPHSAAAVLRNVSSAPFENHAVTVALLSDKARVRSVFGAGAHFVLYKPISSEQAEATLLAATALIKRERRNAFRAGVQVPVKLRLENTSGVTDVEAILLDLSENGMDVLAAQPLCPSGTLHARFSLPDAPTELEIRGEVAWANPNGDSGVRFVGLPDSLRVALRCWVLDHLKDAPPEEAEPVLGCKLSDLSPGGCYVETASPFPERTAVVLTLRAGDVELQAQGLVRVMHPACGMGIEFASHTAEQRAETENFIQFLTNRPGIQPELLVSPNKLVSASEVQIRQSDEVEDALLDLLRNHESFSQEMFLETLRKQRNADFVQS
jgi:CheY-like chemotaxis protein